MTENPQAQGPATGGTPPQFPDPRAERRRWREEHRAARAGRSGGAWVGGAILILLGVVFLLQEMGGLTLRNWWAIFILFPAVGALAGAWRSFQEAGRHLTRQVRSALIGGVVLTLVAAAFLLELNWGLIGPVLIILVGVALLVNAILK
jgi:hypothetical protein